MNKFDSTWSGSFERLKLLGSGAAATVYKARHNQTGHIRAIRYINTHITADNPKKAKSIMEEVKILLRLGNGHNPHVVRAFSFDIVANQPVIELEYIRGIDLDDLIVLKAGKIRSEPGVTRCLPVEDVLNLLRDMSSALSYIHHDLPAYCLDPDTDGQMSEQAIIKKYCTIHNDIHTKNIMRRDTGEYVLLDFGLSLEGSEVTPRSSRGGKGVPEFMAPEKFDSEALTTEADIYGLGVVLFECLTGRVPYPEKTRDPISRDMSMHAKHAKLPLPDLWELRQAKLKEMGLPHQHSDIPVWLDRLVQKCLAKLPKDRFLDGYTLRKEVLKHIEEEAENNLAKQVEQALADERTHSKKEIESVKKRLQAEAELQKKASAEQHQKELYELYALREQLKNLRKAEPEPGRILTLQKEINRLEDEVFQQQQRSVALNEGLKMKERVLELEQQKLQVAQEDLAALQADNKKINETSLKKDTTIQSLKAQLVALNNEKQKILAEKNRDLNTMLSDLGLPSDPKLYVRQLKNHTWRIGLVMTLIGGVVGWGWHSSQIPNDWQSYYPYDSTSLAIEVDSTMEVDTDMAVDSTLASTQPRYTESEAEQLFKRYEQRFMAGYALDLGPLQTLCWEHPIYKDKILTMYRDRIETLTEIDPPGAATLQAKLNELIRIL
jgi:serine/threonine protein kinase